MKYRKFGKSDMNVSSICLGTWVFGGDFWGGADDKESIAVVREAVRKGVNFIDTAPAYGCGHSEEVIGEALKGIKEKVFIATKCGLEIKGKLVRSDLSPGFVRSDVEGSLKRLGRDTIDLIQCHWPDPKTPLKDTLGELEKLVLEGKVRYIGVSNFGKGLLSEALGVLPVVSDQMQYSLFNRDIEKDILNFSVDKGIAIMAYGPLGGGVLTGKYDKRPSFPKTDARSIFYTYYKEPFWSKSRELVGCLDRIAAARNVTSAEVAINWVLSHEAVTSCIVGCRNLKQLEVNAASTEWKLTQEELEEIESEYRRIFG
ncbi:MAG: aldo/keto reductase [Candidatus Omnitrophica bacterium]|nr:aldo/keto reductase [Candidatus Omnitrophota bacterium]